MSTKKLVSDVLELVDPEARPIMANFLAGVPADVLLMMAEAIPESFINILKPCYVEVNDDLKETAYATWIQKKVAVPDFMKDVQWNSLFGEARDQGNHNTCWAFVAAELVEALMKIHGLGQAQYSPQDMVDFVRPDLRKIKKEWDGEVHYCYCLSSEKGLEYVQIKGLQKEEDRPFVGCPRRFTKRTKSELAHIGRVVLSEEIGSIFKALRRQPIKARIPIFQPEYSNIKDKVYGGPRDADSRLIGFHAVTLVSSGVEAGGERYFLARSSHGPRFGCFGGYIKVSLDTMVLRVPRVGETFEKLEKSFLTPKPLLSNFAYPKLAAPGEKKKKKKKKT